MKESDWILKLKLLDNRLRKSNVSPELYRLHGLFGSADEDNRLSLEVTKGKYTIEYHVYYQERGEKHPPRHLLTWTRHVIMSLKN